MSDYIRLTVPILKDDYPALREAAAKEYREPRQHAAWLLRKALGLADNQQTQPNKATNGDSLELEASVAM